MFSQPATRVPSSQWNIKSTFILLTARTMFLTRSPAAPSVSCHCLCGSEPLDLGHFDLTPARAGHQTFWAHPVWFGCSVMTAGLNLSRALESEKKWNAALVHKRWSWNSRNSKVDDGIWLPVLWNILRFFSPIMMIIYGFLNNTKTHLNAHNFKE